MYTKPNGVRPPPDETARDWSVVHARAHLIGQWTEWELVIGQNVDLAVCSVRVTDQISRLMIRRDDGQSASKMADPMGWQPTAQLDQSDCSSTWHRPIAMSPVQATS